MTSKTATTVKSRITLEPTRLDAIMGVCNSPHKCMYNLTARRIFPSASNITVNPNGLSVTLNGEYHHYKMTMKGVQGMANFDHDGAAISDEKLKKAKITLDYVGSKPASYKGTPTEKEAHRKKSARYRARPGYVRPDGRHTLRAQVARTYNKGKKLSKPADSKDLL